VGRDPVLHAAFGKLFVLSTADRAVHVVDPNAWEIERTFELNSGDDPVDLQVVSPDQAYITRRGAKQLLSLDLVSGTVQEGVDLSVFADGDGVPDQASILAYDGRLFIQIQAINFDDPSSAGTPSLAVVDLSTGQILDVDPSRDGLQAIELEGTFPKMKMQVVEETQKLLVSASGAFFDAGGIEVLDLGRLESDGLAIREADDMTGADLGAFVMVSPDHGYLVYSTDLLLSSHLHGFTLSGGVDPTELAVALDYFSPAVAYHAATDSVFFPVGGSIENGLHVFDAATGAQLNDRLIPTAGAPTDLVVLAAIPEPSGLQSAVLAGVALAGLVRRTRRHATTR
jgi:hypothetical protein